jgi:hypothetical protein
MLGNVQELEEPVEQGDENLARAARRYLYRLIAGDVFFNHAARLGLMLIQRAC